MQLEWPDAPRRTVSLTPWMSPSPRHTPQTQKKIYVRQNVGTSPRLIDWIDNGAPNLCLRRPRKARLKDVRATAGSRYSKLSGALARGGGTSREDLDRGRAICRTLLATAVIAGLTTRSGCSRLGALSYQSRKHSDFLVANPSSYEEDWTTRLGLFPSFLAI